MEKKPFWDRYVAFCEKKNVTLTEPVMSVGMHRSAITSWRNGKMPSKSTQDKLAGYFGVTRQYLLEGPGVELDMVKPDKNSGYTSLKTDNSGIIADAPISQTDSGNSSMVEMISPENDRSVVEFIFFLAKTYSQKTDKVLLDKLEIPASIITTKPTKDNEYVPIAADMEHQFYLLLKEYGVLRVLNNMFFAQRILEAERNKDSINLARRFIWDYVSENFSSAFKYSYEKTGQDSHLKKNLYTIVSSKSSDTSWAFYFQDLIVLWDTDYFLSAFEWLRTHPNIEKFFIIFTFNFTCEAMYCPETVYYNPQKVSWTSFVNFVTESYKAAIAPHSSDSQVFLIQLQCETLKKIRFEQIVPSPILDAATDWI